MAAHSSGDVRRPHIPHVYVLIFGLIAFIALLSLVLSPGNYQRDENGRVIVDTFRFDDDLAEATRPERPQGATLVFAVLQAPLRGIEDAAAIIAFILVIGGAFRVLEETRAFATALRSSLRFIGHADLVIIPVSMVLFSIGGATIGMSEEIIPFVLLFVPIVRMLGIHPVVGVAVPLVGSQIGFAGALFNPFSLGIAQGIAGLPLYSGWQFRLWVWLAVTTLGVVFVTRQARRWGYDTETLDPDMMMSPHLKAQLKTPQILVLVTLAAALVITVWGVQRYEWYVTEIGAVFLGMGLVAGLVGRLSANRVARCFVGGARDLVSAALVVGVARGIVVLAEETRILDTILYSTAGALEGLPGAVALNLIFLFQSVLNFFIPSGSGQAALTMPIMAPLADILGLTRQTAVLAFQLGDGFSNMIVPTSAVLMGSLEAGKVSYERWFAFAWQLQLWLLVFGVAVLSLAYITGLGP